MSDVPDTYLVDEPLLGFWDKIASYSAWMQAGVLFYTVGWIALAPLDPLGPISLATGRGAVGMLIQASMLAIVAASIATVIVGRKLPDAGTFAAALGLSILSLRGGTMEFLLLKVADDPGGSNRALAAGLAIEAVGWGVVVAVSMATSAVVSRWFHRSTYDCPPMEDEAPQSTLAGWDLPFVGALLGRLPHTAQTNPIDGVRHVGIATVTMLAAYYVFASSLDGRVITHGQVCFVVAASVGTGGYVAFRFAPVRSALWTVIAVMLAAIVGYTIASATRDAGATSPANLPTSRFLIALPVQVVAVGTATAVATFWWRRVAEILVHLMVSGTASVSVSQATRGR